MNKSRGMVPKPSVALEQSMVPEPSVLPQPEDIPMDLVIEILTDQNGILGKRARSTGTSSSYLLMMFETF